MLPRKSAMTGTSIYVARIWMTSAFICVRHAVITWVLTKNENVSVIIDPNTFEIIGRLRRIDVIERVRKSGRGRGVSRAKIVERFKNKNR